MNNIFTTKPYIPVLVISIVLFIMVFLPWSSASGFGISVSFSGTETGISGLGYLTLIMSIVGAFASFLAVQRYRALITICAGLLALLGAVIYWSRLGGLGLSLSFGLIIALLASLGLLAVGYMDYRQQNQPANPPAPPSPPASPPPPPPPPQQ